ncbi:zinc finger protein 501-like [Chrysoperla carnea]|uniref:zinc finger protein 501-like n=1 Tax=Chrysoperla carnea TaxID=189513 RepID=UPI001D06F546|nr:zinc finger protein 501-like [Chrysoperla carnea]
MSACLQCRLCAEWKVGNELINIKDDKAIQLKLESKIQQFLSLNFDNLQLPNNVCLLCCDKVGSAYDFQELVKKAQQNLLDAIEEKKVNLKTELQEPENDWYQYVETVLNDYDDVVVKEEVKVEENSEIQSHSVNLKQHLDTNEKVEKQTEKKSKNNSSSRKKHGKKITVLDPEIVKRKAKRNAQVQRTKDAWKNFKWKCATCQLECPSVENLRKHFTDEHKQKPVYSCTECSNTYDVFTSFKKHVKKHRDKYKYKCDICSMYFYQPYLLRYHLRSHSDEKNYTCPECGKNLKTANNLQGHLRLHQPDLRQAYECDICKKKLSTAASLLYHQKTVHLGKREFSCEQCGKMFFRKAELQNHLNTAHSDAKPFTCDQCQRSFKARYILRVHLQVHRKQKPHACEVCGKRFTRKGTLTLHSSVHTGVLNFECEYCHKRFRTKPLLKVHIRQHTGERPYSCLECNHHFTNSSNYIKHMRGKHGVKSTRKNEPPIIENNKLENI